MMSARLRTIALVAGLSFVVGACSTMPGNGPTGKDIVSAASSADSSFVLLEINDQIDAIVSRWASPSLYGSFGDRRGPVTQRIGVGDAVQVTIWEAGAGGLFSTPVSIAGNAGTRSTVIPPQVVDRDGSITVPYAGRVMVAGKTAPEVEQLIVQRLQGKAIQPQALVTIAGDVSNTATIAGEVVAGARVPLSARGDRLLDVIAQAGGVRAAVHDIFINLERDGRSVRVPMQKVISDSRENIFVRPGDLITLVSDPQTYTASGATGANAVVPFNADGITLDQAIAKAGGLIDFASDPRNVFVFRFEPRAHVRDLPGVPPNFQAADVVPVVYHIDLRQPKSLFMAKQFPIWNKDIVYVSDSPAWDIQKVATLVNSLTTAANSAADAKYYLKQ